MAEEKRDLGLTSSFIGVILIWTTTPLAIKWSGEGSHFLFGVTARMVIGALLCLALARWRRTPFPFDRAARLTYLACGLGIYGGMTLSYWGAVHIPSGWLSVVFGLTPLLTGVMARLWLGEALTGARLLGMALGMAGLAVIFLRGAALGPEAFRGLLLVVAAATVHSASAVWVKRLGAAVPTLALTAAGVAIAALLDGGTWALSGLGWPAQVTNRAALSILYLGVGGSVLGFLLYYHVLKHLEAMKVALITLVTPVTALLLGRFLNAEPLSGQVLAGTAAILAGLLLFQYGDRMLPARAPGEGSERGEGS